MPPRRRQPSHLAVAASAAAPADTKHAEETLALARLQPHLGNHPAILHRTFKLLQKGREQAAGIHTITETFSPGNIALHIMTAVLDSQFNMLNNAQVQLNLLRCLHLFLELTVTQHETIGFSVRFLEEYHEKLRARLRGLLSLFKKEIPLAFELEISLELVKLFETNRTELIRFAKAVAGLPTKNFSDALMFLKEKILSLHRTWYPDLRLIRQLGSLVQAAQHEEEALILLNDLQRHIFDLIKKGCDWHIIYTCVQVLAEIIKFSLFEKVRHEAFSPTFSEESEQIDKLGLKQFSSYYYFEQKNSGDKRRIRYAVAEALGELRIHSDAFIADESQLTLQLLLEDVQAQKSYDANHQQLLTWIQLFVQNTRRCLAWKKWETMYPLDAKIDNLDTVCARLTQLFSTKAHDAILFSPPRATSAISAKENEIEDPIEEALASLESFVSSTPAAEVENLLPLFQQILSLFVTQNADENAYVRLYQIIPHYACALFFKCLTQLEMQPSKKEAFVENLSKIPRAETDGYRHVSVLQQEQFELLLTHVFLKKRPADELTLDAQIVLFFKTHAQVFLAPPEALRALTSERLGQSILIENANQDYISLDISPLQSGTNRLSDAFEKRLGNRPCRVYGILMFSQTQYLVTVRETFLSEEKPAPSFSSFILDETSARELCSENVNSYHFTWRFLNTLLLSTHETSSQLVIARDEQNTLCLFQQGITQIFAESPQSALFCLPQMMAALDETALREFLSFSNPLCLITSVLTEMETYEQSTGDFLRSVENANAVEVRLHEGDIRRLCERWQKLRRCLSHHRSDTHLSLLEELFPDAPITKAVSEAQMKQSSLQETLLSLSRYGTLPRQEARLVSLSAAKKEAEEFYTALHDLEFYEERMYPHEEHSQIDLFLRKMTSLPVIVFEQILSGFPFQQANEQTQRIIITHLTKQPLQQLCLRGCTALKNKDLEKILAVSPQLRVLELHECTEISVIHITSPELRRVKISAAAQLRRITIEARQLEALDLRNCGMLTHVSTPAKIRRLKLCGLPQFNLTQFQTLATNWDHLEILEIYRCPLLVLSRLPLQQRLASLRSLSLDSFTAHLDVFFENPSAANGIRDCFFLAYLLKMLILTKNLLTSHLASCHWLEMVLAQNRLLQSRVSAYLLSRYRETSAQQQIAIQWIRSRNYEAQATLLADYAKPFQTQALPTENSPPHLRSLTVIASNMLACGFDNGHIRLYDFDTMQSRWALMKDQEVHSSSVYALLALPDGRFVSGSANGSINVYTNAQLETPQFVGCHRGMVSAFCLLNGNRFASASDDGTIKIWEWKQKSWHLEATLEKSRGAIRSVAYSIDGTLFAGTRDGHVQIWKKNHTNAWECTQDISIPEATHLRTLLIYPQSRLLVGTRDGRLLFFHKKEHRWQSHHEIKAHTSAIMALQLLPDGQIISASDAGSLHLWAISDDGKLVWQRELSRGDNQPENAIYQLALWHDHILTGRFGGQIQCYAFETSMVPIYEETHASNDSPARSNTTSSSTIIFTTPVARRGLPYSPSPSAANKGTRQTPSSSALWTHTTPRYHPPAKPSVDLKPVALRFD